VKPGRKRWPLLRPPAGLRSPGGPLGASDPAPAAREPDVAVGYGFGWPPMHYTSLPAYAAEHANFTTDRAAVTCEVCRRIMHDDPVEHSSSGVSPTAIRASLRASQ
jgi:hypothetical protein